MGQCLSFVTCVSDSLHDLPDNSLNFVDFHFNLFGLMCKVGLNRDVFLLCVQILVTFSECFLPLEIGRDRVIDLDFSLENSLWFLICFFLFLFIS